jgi:hypothetical protein
MNRKSALLAMAALLTTAILFVAAPLQTTAPDPAALIPAGPMLCLQAKDFAGELAAWNASPEQKAWLGSMRYRGFSQSHLYLRLHEAWEQFNDAAGLAADSPLLTSIAGHESALALYNIGDLAFLYVTHLNAGRTMQTLLWQTRMKYETRTAGGVQFYVRKGAGNREVAFASAGDWLFIATREEYVADALRLLARENRPTVKQEDWYADSSGAAGSPGELRLVMDLEKITADPHFGSYWIQRNTPEIKQYRAGVSDIRRSATEIREDRVLLRKTPRTAANEAFDIARLAPESADFFQAWTDPDAISVAGLIESKLFAPKVGRADSGRYAPPVDLESAGQGAEADLETRIDQPALRTSGEPTTAALNKLLRPAKLRAVLQIGSARTLGDDIFAAAPAVIAIEAEQPWDAQAVRQTLTDAAANLWTLGANGTSWTEHSSGAQRWYSCDGLARLNYAVAGRMLFLANAPDDLQESLDRLSRSGGDNGVVYQAALRHDRARPGYDRIMSMIDRTPSPGDAQHVPFFSVDLASLSSVFFRVTEERVEIRDIGTGLREQAVYKMR